jgi:hypothetical protein
VFRLATSLSVDPAKLDGAAENVRNNKGIAGCTPGCGDDDLRPNTEYQKMRNFKKRQRSGNADPIPIPDPDPGFRTGDELDVPETFPSLSLSFSFADRLLYNRAGRGR